MTNREIFWISLCVLMLGGWSSFLPASHNARWEAKYHSLPQYVQIADISQYSFKGTFPP